MITLDQVRMLEDRVGKAVGAIEALKAEKVSLREELSRREARNVELQSELDAFKRDQVKIEEGIVNALARLASFEDALHHDMASATSTPPVANPTPVTNPPVRGMAKNAPSSPQIIPAVPASPMVQKADPEEKPGNASGDLGIF